MEFKAELDKCLTDSDGSVYITLKTKNIKRENLPSKPLKVSIKEFRESRSLSANSYCWVLLDKMAHVLNTSKEELYIQKIKQVGAFEITPIKNEAVERWVSNWKSKGLGWHSEIIENSKLSGYKNIINYYGSSVYNTKEMERLINEIISDCKELGIETATQEEQAEMLSLWEAQ